MANFDLLFLENYTVRGSIWSAAGRGNVPVLHATFDTDPLDIDPSSKTLDLRYHLLPFISLIRDQTHLVKTLKWRSQCQLSSLTFLIAK